MRTYLISYDLTEPATIKNLLNSEIMELGDTWARPLANTWYVRSDEAQEVMEAKLRDHLDIDDGLLIQPVSEDAVLMNTGLRWFRQRRTAHHRDAVDNVVAFPAAPAVPTAPEFDDEQEFAEAS